MLTSHRGCRCTSTRQSCSRPRRRHRHRLHRRCPQRAAPPSAIRRARPRVRFPRAAHIRSADAGWTLRNAPLLATSSGLPRRCAALPKPQAPCASHQSITDSRVTGEQRVRLLRYGPRHGVVARHAHHRGAHLCDAEHDIPLLPRKHDQQLDAAIHARRPRDRTPERTPCCILLRSARTPAAIGLSTALIRRPHALIAGHIGCVPEQLTFPPRP
jgi:hypothetical protein